MEAKYVARFWTKIDKRGASECWLWNAGKDTGGYGVFHYAHRANQAHRISWELAHGPIPKRRSYHGTCVLHRCDVRACVNPAHLFLGTHADNMADMDSKGRHRWAVGERQGSARLSTEDILEIRSAYARGVSQRDLAALHGVSQPTIGRVVRHENWVHVDGAAPVVGAETRQRRRFLSAAKLTEADVIEIRRLHESGMTQAEIARRFGVGASNVSLIVNRKNWCDV